MFHAPTIQREFLNHLEPKVRTTRAAHLYGLRSHRRPKFQVLNLSTIYFCFQKRYLPEQAPILHLPSVPFFCPALCDHGAIKMYQSMLPSVPLPPSVLTFVRHRAPVSPLSAPCHTNQKTIDHRRPYEQK